MKLILLPRKSRICLNLIDAESILTKLNSKIGFVETMDYHKSERITMTNYIDKVEVLKKVRRKGFGYVENYSLKPINK